MKTEELVGFLSGYGHVFYPFKKRWFYNDYRQKRFFSVFPPESLLIASVEEFDAFFKDHPALWGVRYLSPPTERGSLTYRWVRRKPYDWNDLSSKVRNRTRFGLKNCLIRRMDLDELSLKAEPAFRDTMVRHGQKKPTTLGLSSAIENGSAYEIWGAFFQDKLVSYMVVLKTESWAHIIIQRSMTDHLKYYPNNALTFTLVKDLLSRQDIEFVNYGADFFNQKSSLDNFKESMGFEKDPIRYCIALSGTLRKFFPPSVCRIIELVLALFPGRASARFRRFFFVLRNSS